MAKFIDGFNIWRWPEWEAFAKRLGIDLSLPIKSCKISLPSDGIATYTIELPVENRKPPLAEEEMSDPTPDKFVATSEHKTIQDYSLDYKNASFMPNPSCKKCKGEGKVEYPPREQQEREAADGKRK